MRRVFAYLQGIFLDPPPKRLEFANNNGLLGCLGWRLSCKVLIPRQLYLRGMFTRSVARIIIDAPFRPPPPHLPSLNRPTRLKQQWRPGQGCEQYQVPAGAPLRQ
jgi:hypothetical protein